MLHAMSYKEWLHYAEQLDVLSGLDQWKKKDTSSLYDERVIKQRIADIKDLLISGNIFTLMFRLRGGLSREQFGMLNKALFTKATSGTKVLVESYHSAVCDALNFVCDSDDRSIPTDAKLAFFNETRHSYGRTALLLSGGAHLGMYHAGLVKCLTLQGLLPRVVSGSSAGSIIAAVIGTKTESEYLEILRTGDLPLSYFNFEWEKNDLFRRWACPVWLKPLRRLVPLRLQGATYALLNSLLQGVSVIKLDIAHLRQEIVAAVGDYTFQEAFDRTGRIINITVAPTNSLSSPRLLNYLTAPHVCVWSAVVASCAIPGVFDSTELIVKEPDGSFAPETEWTSLNQTGSAKDGPKHPTRQSEKFSDGSVENDLPMQQISELFNINHFIVSQTNLHSFFLSTLHMRNIQGYFGLGLATSFAHFLKAECRDWLRHTIQLLSQLQMIPSWGGRRGVVQALTQEYEGRESDVSIIPWFGAVSLMDGMLSLAKNPSKDEFLEIVRVGCNNTYPHLSRIRAHCCVEAALDRCVQRLRLRLQAENEAMLRKGSETRDRTPSFYTSRSTVNLSGLSVSDPMPRARDGQVEEDDDFGFMDDVLAADVSLAAAPQRRDTLDLKNATSSEDASLASELDRPRRPTLTAEGAAEEAFGAEREITATLGSRSLHRAQPPTGIKKTTSMSNFYYQLNPHA